MDVRETYEDLQEALRVGINAALRFRWHAVRVKVSEDSQDGHTVKLQPVTQANVEGEDGTTTQMDLPELQDCPIAFQTGGGVTTTYPVKKGDEGYASISSSPIDTWHQQGSDTSPQIDSRMHNLSDATYQPGGRSDPRKLDKVSNVSRQARSDDGNHLSDLHPDNGITHQSTNMVLGSVGNSTSHLLTSGGVQTNGAKVCLNCG